MRKGKERKTKLKEKDARKNGRRRASIYVGGRAVVRWQAIRTFEDVIVREL